MSHAEYMLSDDGGDAPSSLEGKARRRRAMTAGLAAAVIVAIVVAAVVVHRHHGQEPTAQPQAAAHGGGCAGLGAVFSAVYHDMHDGDYKQVTLGGGLMTIVPHGNSEKWVVKAPLDTKYCNASVNFTVPGKPSPPPNGATLEASVWTMTRASPGASAPFPCAGIGTVPPRAPGAACAGIEFTDPRGTLKAGPPGTVLNTWVA